MNVTYDYSGYIVLVTGAASGIGLAAAQAFGRSSAHVILADLSDDRGHDCTEAIVCAMHQKASRAKNGDAACVTSTPRSRKRRTQRR